MKNLFRAIGVMLTAAASLLCQSCGALNTAQPITSAEEINEVVGTNLEIGEPIDLAVVIGSRRDMNAISTAKLLPIMYELCESSGNLTVIVADGAPKLNRADCTIPPMNGVRDAAFYKKIQQEATNLCSQIESMQAKTPDADLNAALIAAADTLRANPNEEDILIILDNGFTTKGICLETLDGIDIENFYRSIKDELPDLTEIHTVWYGLGETSDLYPDGISRSEKKSLQNFWMRMLDNAVVFKEGQISFLNESNDSIDRSSLPDCKLVSVGEHDHTVQTTIAAVEYEATTHTRTNGTPKQILSNAPLFFNNGIVEFEPDTYELKKSKLPEIRQYLSNVAESLIFYDQEVLLVGSIAHVNDDSPDQGVEFSRRRAESVAAVLIELNVPADHIHINGAGYTDTRISDPRDYTEGNEAIAQSLQSSLTQAWNNSSVGTLSNLMAALRRSLRFMTNEQEESASISKLMNEGYIPVAEIPLAYGDRDAAVSVICAELMNYIDSNGPFALLNYEVPLPASARDLINNAVFCTAMTSLRMMNAPHLQIEDLLPVSDTVLCLGMPNMAQAQQLTQFYASRQYTFMPDFSGKGGMHMAPVQVESFSPHHLLSGSFNQRAVEDGGGVVFDQYDTINFYRNIWIR